MIATKLRPLSEAQPPLSNRVIKVSEGEPIEAQLSDGTAVLVTWIGERTAIVDRRGRGFPALGREMVNLALILVDHEALPWVSDGSAGHFMRGKRRRGVLMHRQKVHRCVGCKRSAGQTRFISPQDDYCIECEGAGRE